MSIPTPTDVVITQSSHGENLSQEGGGAESVMIDKIHIHVNNTHRIVLNKISNHEIKQCLISYRRRMCEVINGLNARAIIENPFLGFPQTLRELRTVDSNQSGSVMFTAECKELTRTLVTSLPKYMVIKISPYMLNTQAGMENRGQFTDSTNHLISTEPSNVEANVLLKLRKLVVRNTIPNICLLYKYCVIPAWTVIDRGVPISALQKWRHWVSLWPPKCRKECIVVMMEYCRGGSLRTLVKQTVLSVSAWKSIIWQVLFTLAMLNDKFPNFRHNDMHLGNILTENTVCARQTGLKWCWKYIYQGETFYIPNHGTALRICDFDWASSTEFVNAKMHKAEFRNDVPQMEGPNVFDIHYFLNVVHSYSKVPKTIKNWIVGVYGREGVRENSTVCINRRLRKNIPNISTMFPTPQTLLHHDFFREFDEQGSMLVIDTYNE